MADMENEYQRMMLEVEERLKRLEKKERELDKKINKLQSIINTIEDDIYEGEEPEESYDFEIVCPYCNGEFVTDLSMLEQDENEIRCPDCNNVIELDWNNDEEDLECSSGHCSRMPWMWNKL